jgi:hypothetical protein
VWEVAPVEPDVDAGDGALVDGGAVRGDGAVVRPIPPGQLPGSVAGSTAANRWRWPSREISTMVVPVPCRLALLLKLLTSTSPRTSFPVEAGTTATP